MAYGILELSNPNYERISLSLDLIVVLYGLELLNLLLNLSRLMPFHPELNSP
jgi:hypothetical protein